MSAAEFQALLPLMILGGTAIAVMLAAAFHQGHGTAVAVTLAGLVASLVSLFQVVPLEVGMLLAIDRFALFYIGLIVVAALVVTVFSHGYLSHFYLKAEEYYMLLVLATLGSCVIASSTHFASFFLGLELLSVSLYVMIGYVFRRTTSLEAAVKYLILAAGSSAFLLFGMALLYAEWGTMEFESLAAGIGTGVAGNQITSAAGVMLMLTGIGFKLAVVPFHWWVPDIYQGAPAPVGGFVATASKGAMLALLFRFLGDFADFRETSVFTVFAPVAVASMTVGNLLALRQGNFKRILAYSSIAHLGYVLVAVLAGGPAGVEAATFYIAVYVLAALAVFGLIGSLSGSAGEPESVERFEGLLWARPWLALVLAVALLSLIGFPPTAGFWGKFLIITAGAKSGLWLLLILLALNSAVGLYYYLRILLAACRHPEIPPILQPVRAVDSMILGGLAVLLLLLGVCPALLLDFIRSQVLTGSP
ncbi:MAG TPA: NADH-quinone oxidoreductase subunit N [Luteolibacter sp.]